MHHLFCLDFGHCDGLKIRAYSLLTKKPVFQPFFFLIQNTNKNFLETMIKKLFLTQKICEHYEQVFLLDNFFLL